MNCYLLQYLSKIGTNVFRLLFLYGAPKSISNVHVPKFLILCLDV